MEITLGLFLSKLTNFVIKFCTEKLSMVDKQHNHPMAKWIPVPLTGGDGGIYFAASGMLFQG